MQSKYNVVSGVLFGAIALAQAARALSQWPVRVDGLDVPVWVSWIATAVALSMSVWAFRSARK